MIVSVEESREKHGGLRLFMVLVLVVTGSAVALMVANGDDGEIMVVATRLSSLHGCFRSNEDDDDGGATESMLATMHGATARVDGKETKVPSVFKCHLI